MAEETKPKKKKKNFGTKASPRSKVTPELFEELLLWYVNNGNQHVRAARLFGLSRRTVSGLYYMGMPSLNKPPMRILIDNVEVRARAARALLKKEELARAEKEMNDIIQGTANTTVLGHAISDSIKTRAEEGAVVSAGRRNILKMQSMLAPLMTGAVLRMKELEKDIKRLAPEDLIKLMKDLTKIQGDLISAAKTNMDMERQLLGDPNGAEDTKNKPLNREEAFKVIELAARTAERMRSEGRLVDAEGEEIKQNPVLDLDDEDDDTEEDDESPDEETEDTSQVSLQ
jgi:hypothetical protein